MESYLNGIKDEWDTVKSNEEFYERMDELVLKLSKLCPNGAVKDQKEAVAFTFNREYGKRKETIIVPLMMLWPVFQGRMPKPENFRESRT